MHGSESRALMLASDFGFCQRARKHTKKLLLKQVMVFDFIPRRCTAETSMRQLDIQKYIYTRINLTWQL